MSEPVQHCYSFSALTVIVSGVSGLLKSHSKGFSQVPDLTCGRKQANDRQAKSNVAVS